MARKKSIFTAIDNLVDVVSTIHHAVNHIPVTSDPKRNTLLYTLKQMQKQKQREERRKQLYLEEELKNERFRQRMLKQRLKLIIQMKKNGQDPHEYFSNEELAEVAWFYHNNKNNN